MHRTFLQSRFFREVNRYFGLCLISVILTGCNEDESAMFCIEQSPGPSGINVSNQCNETVTVKTDTSEMLIIAAGQTHELLRAGQQLGACFSPKEPGINGQRFRCD